MNVAHPNVAAVVIGRNEGERLIQGLTALQGRVGRIIYVDSGSTDGSVPAAKRLGASVVPLDLSKPFTAARARNAGLQAVAELQAGTIDYVQFIDGDCELRSGWLEAATEFLGEHPDIAAICGRRRERYPENSVYNRLIDMEWNTPVGQAKACGGDALMRLDALQAVGGFDPSLIAGEEPELCVRLRAAGWRIWRLDAEMTWHDAALTRFSQWWTRARRAGHAYAEGAALHGAPPERHNVAQTRRALIWGVGSVVLLVFGLLLWWPLLVLLFSVWIGQITRLAQRSEDPVQAFFLTLSKLPEALGALSFYRSQMGGEKQRLIEYK